MDAPLRQLVTAVGGYDLCTSEFVRITANVVPRKSFTGLGQNQNPAQNYLRHLGFNYWVRTPTTWQPLPRLQFAQPSIDLNFGCPAKTVNASRGGSVLLDEPDLIFEINEAVRQPYRMTFRSR